MADKPPKPGIPSVIGAETAPFIYFDGVTTYGVNFGAIQIELAANIIAPAADQSTITLVRMTGHLRCSPNAAGDLMQALEKAIEMGKSTGTGSAKPEGRLN
jgi:hypothetical protein